MYSNRKLMIVPMAMYPCKVTMSWRFEKLGVRMFPSKKNVLFEVQTYIFLKGKGKWGLNCEKIASEKLDPLGI